MRAPFRMPAWRCARRRSTQSESIVRLRVQAVVAAFPDVPETRTARTAKSSTAAGRKCIVGDIGAGYGRSDGCNIDPESRAAAPTTTARTVASSATVPATSAAR